MGYTEFLVKTQSELRRVNWPSRNQVINHSIIVLAALTFIVALIAGLDWVFGQGILQLLRSGS